MRTHLKGKLQVVDEEWEGPPPPHDLQAVAHRAMVQAHGPRVAAWLVRHHRKALHATGAVDFVMPKGLGPVTHDAMQWFFIAMQCLQRRGGWDVTRHDQPTRCVYRVRWHGWRYGRAPQGEQPS